MEQFQNPTIETEKKKSKLFSIILIASIILNLLLIIKINNPQINITGAATLIHPEINKDLANNVDSSSYILHYQDLRNNLENEIKLSNAEDNLAYFIQDLKTGSWVGREEKEGFTPASLLKVPIMLAILKKVESGELNLDSKLVIREEDIDLTYPTPYEKKAGVEVTVRDLLKSMITHSDNTAKNALIRQLFAYEVDDVFKHLGIPNPYLPGAEQNRVSPRGYSRLFKAMYYSTYVKPDLSEFALKLTTNTQTENLIPEGVPEDIEVAHKFGIYNEDSLHDCGIVYHPKNPYIICVMTKGLSSIEGSELIRKISKNTYEFVETH